MSSSSSSSSTEIFESTSSSSSSELSSGEKVILANRYTFSGYQLPKIQLDETGPTYYQLQPHPYYSNQPTYWEKPAYKGFMPLNSEVIGGSNIQPPELPYPVVPPPASVRSTQGMTKMIPLE